MSAAAVATSLSERNAANAQHSTGPVTAEGKATSARNSLRHGLTARTVVLKHESQADYEALKLEFEREYEPGSGVERQMLNRMVDCWWKLLRVSRIEAEFLDQRGEAMAEDDPASFGDAALIGLFCNEKESQKFRLFMRYLTNVQKAWRTALAEYQETRKARLEREFQQDMWNSIMDARQGRYDLEEEEPEEGEEETDGEQTEEEEVPAEPAAPALAKSGFVSHPVLTPEPARPVPGQPRRKR